eukprot:GGOE01061966.1.p1 GENE.GGOE01061966.1~~GGOE01061966.1.p1  ORF type:complete len:452 (+),score=146.59 GGOE01061966.1:196-1356(+)
MEQAGSTTAHNSIFEFHDVTKVSKVHQERSLKLDYWCYEVVLETDYEVFRKPRNTTDLVTVVCRRRYKEFEWLRETLAAEYPFSIVPPLPGFALEGMMEKVDNVLGTSEATPEVPALVTYRMRGISLFMKWLAKCPNLRESSLLQCFLELPSEELATFQASCKKPVRSSATSSLGRLTISGVWGSIQRTIKGTPKAMNQDVLTAKTFLTNMETALAAFKDQVEKLWDQIVNLCEGYTVERLDQSLQKTDEVIQALVKTAVVVKRAVHNFSVENEELFLALVIDLSFFSGLCAAGKAVAANLEHMAGDVQQLQGMQKGAEAGELQHTLDQGCETFLTEYRRFHQVKKPALKKMVRNFAMMASNMDPKNFTWEKYCTPLVNMIPEPEW